jgi:hypothetical protein
MAGMTRTRGLCTGYGAVLLAALGLGCAQQTQSSQPNTRHATRGQQAAAQQAAAQQAASPVSPVAAVINPIGAATDAAIGAAAGVVTGAVNTATGTKPAPKGPRIKPNGRGGYDASELQADAIRRAHLMSQRYGVTKVTRARNGVLAGQPSTQPSTQP